MDLKLKIFKRLVGNDRWEEFLENEVNQWIEDNANATLKETTSYLVHNEKTGQSTVIILFWYFMEKKTKIGI